MKIGGHLGFLKLGNEVPVIINLERVLLLLPADTEGQTHIEFKNGRVLVADEPFEDVWKAVMFQVTGEVTKPESPPSPFERTAEFGGYKGETE